MDLRYSEEAELFRLEVREWISSVFPSDWRGSGDVEASERASWLAWWRDSLREVRLLAPGWPEEFGGRGRDLISESILAEELARAGVPRYPHSTDSSGLVLLGPTLLHWGTDEQKKQFLQATIDGEVRWCQGYSEPEAGSDLFNVKTQARLVGDEWVVNGQKVWQSGGLDANWIFLVARTDPEAERSKGLSFLLLPMDQPGVDVRGIRSMADDTELAEVFFTDARTAASNVVGGVGNGSKVAITLLGYERGAGGVAAALEARAELDRLVEFARRTGRASDTAVRRRIAACRATVHTLHCLALRALASGSSGEPPGPESSITKLVTSEYRHQVTELALDVAGRGILAPSGAPGLAVLGPHPAGIDPTSTAVWTYDFLHARPTTIYGGSSEIQRNTIGEQVLGLPREPRVKVPRTS
ncbi:MULTISPECIES: acyl-CoA dehydrogenase family protein [unclassified Pseudofrankia]|uniref:acyl-CoA dehydrogenase family protein n=1 Tax=unclassified Pseudofrankia TaxID=2994372 RepID=UPI0008DA1329|nr:MULTISPECIES: acyl-CoA dehydrogenase family protein [unclassified Pseudofrankia]MDT3445621.1 acyl-CoA dehydrogenase family protein [Pseudofrankia sp. BMG5.37]OHV63530.1 acyl-CoA dehydrogenase [Pseudofrankia sp. BMG5.36]